MVTMRRGCRNDTDVQLVEGDAAVLIGAVRSPSATRVSDHPDNLP
jgi:hypothetical protein